MKKCYLLISIALIALCVMGCVRKQEKYQLHGNKVFNPATGDVWLFEYRGYSKKLKWVYLGSPTKHPVKGTTPITEEVTEAPAEEATEAPAIY